MKKNVINIPSSMFSRMLQESLLNVLLNESVFDGVMYHGSDTCSDVVNSQFPTYWSANKRYAAAFGNHVVNAHIHLYNTYDLKCEVYDSIYYYDEDDGSVTINPRCLGMCEEFGLRLTSLVEDEDTIDESNNSVWYLVNNKGFMDTLKRFGYDGIIGKEDGVDMCVVFDGRKSISCIQHVNESLSHTDSSLEELFHYLQQKSGDSIYDTNHQLATDRSAFDYFEPKEIVHNRWGLHFTNMENWQLIQKEGFRGGVSNYDNLAYSHGKEHSNHDGFFFALDTKHNTYLGDDRGYGDCGVLVNMDGVLVRHLGDGDDEIIFRNQDVHETIPFIYDDWKRMWKCGDNYYNTIKDMLKGVV